MNGRNPSRRVELTPFTTFNTFRDTLKICWLVFANIERPPFYSRKRDKNCTNIIPLDISQSQLNLKSK